MCLDLGFFGYKRKAIWNKTVYKIIVKYSDCSDINYYETLFRGCQVNLNETYSSGLDKRWCDKVREGLHTFTTKRQAIEFFKNSYIPNSGNKIYVLVKCIIPKGASYYKGKFEGYSSIASDKLYYTNDTCYL